MTGMRKVPQNGATFDAYIAVPQGPGPYPAVVLTHHRTGLDEFTRDRADRLAAAGYLTLAPDMFHRSANSDDHDAKGKALTDAGILADIKAAVSYLEALPEADGDRLAILGYCMGARMAFMGAVTVPAFKAAVICYCGGMFTAKGDGPTAFERIKDIRCPVVGFFGREDTNPSPAQVAEIDAELSSHGIWHEFHIYDGAGHAFQAYERPERYNEAAANHSWNRAFTFLAEHLGMKTGAGI